jgi:hypothetical protein
MSSPLWRCWWKAPRLSSLVLFEPRCHEWLIL